MNDYNQVISEVKRQIDNTQSKINLYYDQAPPSNSFYPIPYRSIITQVPTPSKSSPYTQNFNSVASQAHYFPQRPIGLYSQHQQEVPYNNTQPFPNRSEVSHMKPKAMQIPNSSSSLPPINLNPSKVMNLSILPSMSSNNFSPFEQNNANTSRIKITQASMLKNQLQINKLNKQKQGYEQYLQNSMIVQNNIVNYPYGSVHSTIMEKIITQKNISDYQNQRILLRFQKQTEQFKKSKSKNLKNLQNIVVNSKDMTESHYRQQHTTSRVRQASFDKSASDSYAQSMFFNGKNQTAQSQKLPHRKNESVSLSKGKTIQTQLSVSHYQPSIQIVQDLKPQSTSIKYLEQQESRSISPSIKTNKNTKHLLPITDEGQDGLKLIRKNLYDRKKSRINNQFKYKIKRNATKTTIEQSEQQDNKGNDRQYYEIKEVIQDISDIIKSNRSYVSQFHRRVKTNPNILIQAEQSYSPASKAKCKVLLQEREKNKNQVRDNSQINPNIPKLKLNLARLRKRESENPQTLEKTRCKLMELSEIFE